MSEVNMKYILSEAYRKKFDKITSNAAVNKTLYDCAVKILQHRNGTEYEDMYWVSINTGKIVAQSLNATVPLEVKYTAEIEKIICGRFDLITIHNHPNGTAPSTADFGASLDWKYLLGVVIAHNGRVFVYSTNIEIPITTLDKSIVKFLLLGYNINEAYIHVLTELAKAGFILFEEVN